MWMAAWLIVQKQLPFLRCEKGTSFDKGVGRLQTIFVFADDGRGQLLVREFNTTNPHASIKKLRDTLAELRAEIIRVNNSPATRAMADNLSRLCNPELTGGDDE